MNLISSVILIIISLGTFFIYIDPNYQGQNLSSGKKSVQELLTKDGEYQKALADANTIREKRQVLQDKKDSFSQENIDRLEKLLPDNIDNIKLVINLNQIAQSHNLTLKNIKLDPTAKAEAGKISQDNSKYGSVGLSFSVNSSYLNFQNFLTDLERSLRLVEVTDLAVTGTDTGIYEFSLTLKTYWLK